MSDFFIPAAEYCKRVFDGTHDSPKPSLSGFPLVTSKNIKGNSLDLTGSYLISASDYHHIQKRSYVSQWDILFSMIGTVGDTYLEKKSAIPYAVKNVGVFSTCDRDRSQWLYYYLKSPAAKKHIQRHLSGAVQKFLSLGALRSFPVPQFDADRARNVKLLSLLDEKIELNNRINTELEGLAKLLYDYWFVQFDFPMTAEQAAAHGDPTLTGKPYKSSGGKMTHNKTLNREIPDGWVAKELGDVVKITRGSSPRPINDFIADSGTPWIKISDATKTNSRFILETKQFINEAGRKGAKLLPAGSLILSNSATPGIPRIPMIDCGVHDGWLVIENFTSGLSRDILFHFFTSERPRIVSLGNGSIFKNLKTDYVKSLGIAIPPIELFSKATKFLSPINEQILNTTRQNQELAALRDWLLPMLMNGQVTVGS